MSLRVRLLAQRWPTMHVGAIRNSGLRGLRRWQSSIGLLGAWPGQAPTGDLHLLQPASSPQPGTQRRNTQHFHLLLQRFDLRLQQLMGPARAGRGRTALSASAAKPERRPVDGRQLSRQPSKADAVPRRLPPTPAMALQWLRLLTMDARSSQEMRWLFFGAMGGQQVGRPGAAGRGLALSLDRRTGASRSRLADAGGIGAASSAGSDIGGLATRWNVRSASAATVSLRALRARPREASGIAPTASQSTGYVGPTHALKLPAYPMASQVRMLEPKVRTVPVGSSAATLFPSSAPLTTSPGIGVWEPALVPRRATPTVQPAGSSQSGTRMPSPAMALRQPAPVRATDTASDSRDIDRRVMTRVVQEILQPGRTRDSLSRTLADAALTPRLLQAMTERVVATIDKRNAIERYRLGRG